MAFCGIEVTGLKVKEKHYYESLYRCVRSYYTEASAVVVGLWLWAGLDGQEFSGLPGVRRVDFLFPFRTVSSSLGLNVRGTKPSASATSTIHNGPGKEMHKTVSAPCCS